MSELQYVVEFVARATWSVAPAFLVSVLLGVLVRALKLDGAIGRAFGARIGVAILLATVVGAFSPFCSCTVVPVVSGLLLAGVPLAPVMAFWIASPTMDPEIFALSVATLGWPVALARLGATLAISLGAGYATWALTRGGLLANPLRASQVRRSEPVAAPPAFQGSFALSLVPAAMATAGAALAVPLATVGAAATTVAPAAVACTRASCGTPRPTGEVAWWQGLAASARRIDWQQVGRDTLVQGWSLGRWLLLAFTLEALILRYVPQAAIAGTLGQDNPLAVPMAALVGIPLYLNNMSALPIVSGLLAQGMQPGAAIAFLVAGPVTTIPAMTAVWGIARRQVFALYVGAGLLGSIVAGLVTNLVL